MVSASVNLPQKEATVQAIGISAVSIAQAATAAGYPARVITDQGGAGVPTCARRQQRHFSKP
ncbi:hypothetical protein Z949_1883 [Sulfitobacter guttiformis KCTC 32187]|nr:hypothetical protein Z949_1883 [Sulfitobacter guttiformis KCTC 32187]